MNYQLNKLLILSNYFNKKELCMKKNILLLLIIISILTLCACNNSTNTSEAIELTPENVEDYLLIYPRTENEELGTTYALILIAPMSVP